MDDKTKEELKEIIKSTIDKALIENVQKLTLTIKEASELTGIGRDKIIQLVYTNKIPYFKVGSKTLINRAMLVEWLNDISKDHKEL